MSHIVTVKSKFKDPVVLQRVCEKMGIKCELAEKGKTLRRDLYSSQSVEGVAAFQLPGWNYPVVVTQEGEIKYDNYNGHWGEQAKLDQVSQNYSRDFTVESLKSKGYRVIDERVEQDGTIELVMGE